MSRYRKVYTQFWNDSKVRGFSDDAKMVFLFLMTHPHMTSMGIMRASLQGLAAELGWSFEKFKKAFQIPFDKGMVKYDEKACCIALPNFLKHNKPENPNVVKSWIKIVADVPECDLKAQVLQDIKDFLEGLPKGFQEAFTEPYRKGMPKPEPEPEPEQEQEKNSCAEPEKSGSTQNEDAIMSLPLIPKDGDYPITQSLLDEYKESYPGIDVVVELKKAIQWSKDNPSKRKTKRGARKFMGGWLGRAQDRSGGRYGGQGQERGAKNSGTNTGRKLPIKDTSIFDDPE